MSDVINSPRHYTAHASGIEAIEICEPLDFVLGNAVKYLFREGHKGSALEDLRKSAWYLDRAIGKMHYVPVGTHMPIAKVIASEPVGSVLRDVLELTVQRMLNGDQPRVADALARVEREIMERSAHA